MRSDRHPPIPSPRAKVIYRVGHERVGCSLPRTTPAIGGKCVAERTKDVQRVAVGELVIPITVFFLETPRTPLIAATSADIEAAIDIRRRIKPRGGKDLTVRPGEMDG